MNQPFTFDDIEKYTRIYWRGRHGWILDKGSHVSDAADAQHILVQYDQEYNGSSTTKIHENVVNRRLGECRKLWIDFDEHLSGDDD